jgi:2-succinyl-5-enolpyruvyl-6-hydroxy-3-cyclohexene-1-carboxylate synthase
MWAMAEGKVTQDFAATFVDQLARSGLTDVCVSPGSRSAPLAIAFARHPGIRVWIHVDERCGSFFAVGMAKAAGRPVALLCTSGSAAAEFHPAVVEASYSRTPLLVLTADRPPELREVGANQAIDQAHLYGTAVRWYCDPGPPASGPDAARGWRRLAARALAETTGRPAGPVHLNLPFREPLTPPPGEPAAPLTAAGATLVQRSDQPSAAMLERFAALLGSAQRPLVVAGEMRDGSRLAGAVAALGAPVLAEPTSQLRLAGSIAGYDALLRERDWAAGHQPDLVLRLGATPTSKLLNQWLKEVMAPTVLVDPAAGWRDPDLLAGEVFAADPLPLLAACSPAPAGWREEWQAADRVVVEALAGALAAGPLFEAQAVQALAAALPARATLFVGSSMAIRDVDTFWPAAQPGRLLLGNRGASGIDGLVSSGLGAAAARGEPAALLLGDLSLYHDMNGLWAARRHGLRATLVVLDNDGGGIFNFLPPAEHQDVFEELFGTPLGLRLEDVARLYGLGYFSVEKAEALGPALQAAVAAEGSTLVRVAFSREASVRGHRACWAAVSEALGRERVQ